MRRITGAAEEPMRSDGGEPEQYALKWSFGSNGDSTNTTTDFRSAHPADRWAREGRHLMNEAGAVACKSGALQFRTG
jgi:hypothetical protein